MYTRMLPLGGAELLLETYAALADDTRAPEGELTDSQHTHTHTHSRAQHCSLSFGPEVKLV